MQNFSITNLGPIGNVSINFGDLTIIVGPQASGKSIALETLKLFLDSIAIQERFNQYNYTTNNKNILFDLYYGEGMSSIWKDNTVVRIDDSVFCNKYKYNNTPKAGESLFYIPAQRMLSIADGRPKNFMEFGNSSPYVARVFSETIRLFLQVHTRISNRVFPTKKFLDNYLQKIFDKNIFYHSKIIMKEYTGQRKLTLNVDDLHIPFMAWSSGQKEFMPLLLAFYYLEDHLSDGIKKDKYKYVVIEEPEMGLHPKAIISIILQIINLMQTYGYKIIISTHSSVFLEFTWAFNMLKSTKSYQGIYKIFDIEDSTIIKNMLRNIYDKTIKTYYFSRSENDKVVSHDISSLDVASEDAMISEWGGISEFSSKMSDIVSQYGIDNEKIEQEYDYDTIAPSMF